MFTPVAILILQVILTLFFPDSLLTHPSHVCLHSLSSDFVHNTVRRLLFCRFRKLQHVWVHEQCARWCPEVQTHQNQLLHVEAGIHRGRALKCRHCGAKGATLGCMIKSCLKSYHLGCGRDAGCLLNSHPYRFFCPSHVAVGRAELQEALGLPSDPPTLFVAEVPAAPLPRPKEKMAIPAPAPAAPAMTATLAVAEKLLMAKRPREEVVEIEVPEDSFDEDPEGTDEGPGIEGPDPAARAKTVGLRESKRPRRQPPRRDEAEGYTNSLPSLTRPHAQARRAKANRGDSKGAGGGKKVLPMLRAARSKSLDAAPRFVALGPPPPPPPAAASLAPSQPPPAPGAPVTTDQRAQEQQATIRLALGLKESELGVIRSLALNYVEVLEQAIHGDSELRASNYALVHAVIAQCSAIRETFLWSPIKTTALVVHQGLVLLGRYSKLHDEMRTKPEFCWTVNIGMAVLCTVHLYEGKERERLDAHIQEFRKFICYQ